MHLINVNDDAIFASLRSRTVSGATVMSILPIAYSVLGDLFPPKTRGSMSTWLVIAMGAGVMLGQLMSGLLGPRWLAIHV